MQQAEAMQLFHTAMSFLIVSSLLKLTVHFVRKIIKPIAN
jgi:hypothetical protein